MRKTGMKKILSIVLCAGMLAASFPVSSAVFAEEEQTLDIAEDNEESEAGEQVENDESEEADSEISEEEKNEMPDEDSSDGVSSGIAEASESDSELMTAADDGNGTPNSDTNKQIESVSIIWKDSDTNGKFSGNEKREIFDHKGQENSLNTVTALRPGNDYYYYYASGRRKESSANYTYQINFGCSGTYEHSPYSIEIRVPAHIFPMRDDPTQFADEYVNWSVPDRETASQPSYSGTNELCYWYDEETDEYVITNCVEVKGGYHGKVDLTIKIDNPVLVEDGIKNDLPTDRVTYEDCIYTDPEHPEKDSIIKELQVTARMLNGVDQEGEKPTIADEKKSNTLYAQLDTGAVLNKTEKKAVNPTGASAASAYQKWQTSWGTQPTEDGDDYVYVVWEMYGELAVYTPFSQPFDISIEDSARNITVEKYDAETKKYTDKTASVEMEVVGFRDMEGSERRYTDEQGNPIICTENGVATLEKQIVDDPSFASNNRAGYYVLTKFKRADLENGDRITNTETCTLTGIDDQIPQVKKASASLTYSYEPFSAPSGWYSVEKSETKLFPGEKKVLESGQDTDRLSYGYDFRNKAAVQGYWHTLDRNKTHGEAVEEDYGKEYYTVSLADDMLFLCPATDSKTNYAYGYGNPGSAAIVDYYRLLADDYRINTVYLYSEAYNYNRNDSTGQFQWEKVKVMSGTDEAECPEIKLYVKMADGTSSDVDALEWKEVGTIKTHFNYWYIYPSFIELNNEFAGKVNLNTGEKTVEFADELNVVGFRFDVATTYSEIDLNANIEAYQLKSNEHTRALSAGESSEADYIYNVNSLRVYDYNDEQITMGDAPGNNISNNYLDERNAKLGETSQQVWHDDSYNLINEPAYSSYLNKRLIAQQNNPNEKRVDLTYQVEQSGYYKATNSKTDQELVENGTIRPNYTGTFYDLLPYGVVPNPDSVKVTTTNGYSGSAYMKEKEISNTSVRVVTDWNKTGRTMLIVDYEFNKNADGTYNMNDIFLYKDTDGTRRITEKLTFDAYYSWDNLQDFGKTLKNLVGYESGNQDIIEDGKIIEPGMWINSTSGTYAYPDNGKGFLEKDFEQKLTDAEKQEAVDAYTDVNRDGQNNHNFLYSEDSTVLNVNTSATFNLSKQVKGVDNVNFDYGREDSVVVPAGSEYYYQIRMGVPKGSQTRDMIVFDSLENYTPKLNEQGYELAQEGKIWHGTFDSIDMSQVKAKGIAPAAYYSDIPNLDIAENHDLSDSNVWKPLTENIDKSKVKAIAVDLRKGIDGNDYVLKEEETINLKVAMIAPDDPEVVKQLMDDNAHAYNNIYAQANTYNAGDDPSVGTKDLIYQNYTQVLLRNLNIDLEKTSDPESGTVSAPTVVKGHQSMTYDIAVENKEVNMILEDTKVVDVIPDGLTFDSKTGIQYYFESNPAQKYSAAESPLVSVAMQGQTLSLTIRSLKQGEKIHFLIPVIVETQSVTTKYDNKAKITESNGGRLDITSDSTYHEMPVYTSFGIQKSVKGMADANKAFKFHIFVKDKDQKAVVGEQKVSVFKTDDIDSARKNNNAGLAGKPQNSTVLLDENGEGYLSIKAGETAYIYGLPEGAAYEVKEVSSEGYTLVSSADTKGNASVIGDDPNPVTAFFVNSYEAKKPLSVTIKKTVNGEIPSADESFDFQVERADLGTAYDAAEGYAKIANEWNKNGSLTINLGTPGTIVNSEPGKEWTYEKQFRVLEYNLTNDGEHHTTELFENGYSRDQSVYIITYNCKDNGAGEITAVPVIKKIKDAQGNVLTTPETVTEILFNNTYNPLPVDFAVKVGKEIDGNARPVEKTFTFTLAKDEGTAENTPMPESPTASVTGQMASAFPAITFTEAGTYKYKITENDDPELSTTGYTFDGTVHHVVVNVADDNGHLKVDWTVDGVRANNETFIKFVNTYSPTAAVIKVPVQKKWTDDSQVRPDDTSFSFKMTPEKDEFPMPAADTISITVPAGDNSTVSAGSFGKMTFTKAGDYFYAINEINDQQPGYSYNVNENGGAASYTLRVHVSDNNGKLEAVYYLNDAVGGTAVFTNRYQPGIAELTIPVQKAFTEGSLPRADEKSFEFEMSPKGDDPLPEYNGGYIDNSVTITGAGSTSFKTGKFTSTGVYTYFIRENIPRREPAGYSYDTSVYKVTVTVTDSNGQLNASYTIEKGEGTYEAELTGMITPADQILFRNTYKPGPAKLKIPVKKVINGQTPVSGKEFLFNMIALDSTKNGEHIDASEVPLPNGTHNRRAAVTITGDAEGAFEEITFTEPGVYNYEVGETAPTERSDNDPYTYDAKKHFVTVTVVDDAGVLKASWKLDNKAAISGSTDGSDTKVIFTNIYTPKAVPFTVTLSKTLKDGSNKLTKDEPFVFEVTAETAGAPLPANNQIKIVAPKGSEGGWTADRAFSWVEFTETGTYKYKVKEVPGNSKGFTYDKTVHEIEVVITDQGGVLKADWKLDGEIAANDTTVDFENEYKSTPVELSIPVKKEFTENSSARPEKNEFTFAISGNNVPLPRTNTVTACEEQEVCSTFDPITFTKAGTYIYTISEKDDGRNGYTYAASKTIVVNVTDENGTLKTDWQMEGTAGNETAVPVTMINSYHAAPANISLKVKKTFADNGYSRPVEKQFSFVLKDDRGNVVDTQSVTGNSTAVFMPLTFTAVGTYHYTVAELTGNENGYTYDVDENDYAIAHQIEITVVDDGGSLLANWTWDGNKADESDIPSITNTYRPEDVSFAIPVQKTISGQERPQKDGMTDEKIFRFQLKAENDAPMPEDAQNNTKVIEITGEGASDFGDINYSKPGIYTYIVSEVAGNDHGYVYVKENRVVVVNVADVNGQLQVNWKVDDREASADTKVVFDNTYAPEQVTFTIPIEKVLEGDNPPADQEFLFDLKGENDKTPMPEDGDRILKIKGSGKAVFGTIRYTEVGTYSYTVTEQKGTAAGYEYDASVHNVKVMVSDENGELKVSWELDGDVAGTDTRIVFINKYNEEHPKDNNDKSHDSEEKGGRVDNNPDTGDSNSALLSAAMMLMAIAAMFAVLRKRSNQ